MTTTLESDRVATATRAARRGVHPSLCIAMIITPIVWLAAEAISPALKSNAADQLAVIAAHPTRWYWYTMLLVIGSVTGIPAAVGLLQLGAARMPRIGAIGGTLVALGFVGSVVDCANQLWSWQLAESGRSRAQAAALLDRFDNAAGINLIFAVTGIGLLIGTVLLTTALVRNRTVPSWVAVIFGVAVVVNVVAFSAISVAGVATSCVLLLVGMGGLGFIGLRATFDRTGRVNVLEPATS
jgi:hypothetical protein